jgi:hypothetical protein
MIDIILIYNVFRTEILTKEKLLNKVISVVRSGIDIKCIKPLKEFSSVMCKFGINKPKFNKFRGELLLLE